MLQLLAAVATRDAIEKETGQKVRVKWPNDLVLDEKKLGGILVEAKMVKDSISFAILGIGVNVNQTERSLPEGAVSIYTATKRKARLGTLLRRSVQSLESRYADLESPSRLLSDWWGNCIHREKRVEVEGPEGILIGVSRGIDEYGQLIVETTPGVMVTIAQGTLRVVG